MFRTLTLPRGIARSRLACNARSSMSVVVECPQERATSLCVLGLGEG